MKKMLLTIVLLVLLVGAQFPTYPVQAASSQLSLPVTVRPVGGAITILSGGLKGVTGGVGLEPTDWGDCYRV